MATKRRCNLDFASREHSQALYNNPQTRGNDGIEFDALTQLSTGFALRDANSLYIRASIAYIEGLAGITIGAGLEAAAAGTATVAAKVVLSRAERLSMFKNNLSKTANPSNPEDALSLINKTLDNIELRHASASDRMFGILDSKYVTYHSNGGVTALTKGHRIEIQSNGMFSIFE